MYRFFFIASQVRVAHVTSQNVFQMSSDIDQLYEGFDIVLKYLDYKFTNSTTIKTICNTYREFAASNRSVVNGDSVSSQKKVIMKSNPNLLPSVFVLLFPSRPIGFWAPHLVTAQFPG